MERHKIDPESFYIIAFCMTLTAAIAINRQYLERSKIITGDLENKVNQYNTITPNRIPDNVLETDYVKRLIDGNYDWNDYITGQQQENK